MSDIFGPEPWWTDEDEFDYEPYLSDPFFTPSTTATQGLGYRDYLLESMRYGLTREKAAQVVPESQFTDYESAIGALEERYAQGYSAHVARQAEHTRKLRAAAQRENQNISQTELNRIGVAPTSPAQWAAYPGHLRERRLSNEPVQYDQYGGAMVPEGHIHRSNAAFSFAARALRSSWLGQTAGRFMSTFAQDKIMKRIQMLGAHERVQLSNRPSVASPLRYGTTSRGHEMLTPLRGAVVIGGDPGPPGQGYMDPRVGSVVQSRAMDVRGEGIGTPAAVGDVFPAGKPVRLASNVAGFETL